MCQKPSNVALKDTLYCQHRFSRATHNVNSSKVIRVPITVLRRFVFLLATVLTGLVCSPANAWWDVGHRQVCERAVAHTQPATRAAIADLLDAPLGELCSWADEIKGQRPETRQWHYLNAPPDTLSIGKVPRPDGGDIITALNEQIHRLKHGPASQRREALLWVGHLIGDLHQPLHVGYASDLGGNTYRLALPEDLGLQLHEKRERVSMHAVWDGLILRYPGPPPAAATATPIERPLLEHPEVEIMAWADETLAVLNDPNVHYRHGTRLQTLTSHYLVSNRPAVDRQIRRAAARLAAVLDWAIGQ